MYSYISERRGKDTGYLASFKGSFKHIGRLIIYNFIFGLLVLIGSMFFIVPGVIAYIIFVFGYCYILDLKLNLSDAITGIKVSGKQVPTAEKTLPTTPSPSLSFFPILARTTKLMGTREISWFA